MLDAAVIRKEEKDCLVTWRLPSHIMEQDAVPQQANGIAAVACAHSPEPFPLLKMFLLIGYMGSLSLKRILPVQTCNIGVVNRKIVTKFKR